MKRTRWKYAAAALLAAALIGALPGSAASRWVTRDLEYRNIQVTLDGEVLDLRNAAGDEVEPFIMDGTNYLPVRALAEALGLKVAWDSENATVRLTTPGAKGTRQEGSGDIGEYHIDLIEAKLSADSDGDPIILFRYLWTNNSESTDIAYGSIDCVAFQDGVELDEVDVTGLFSGPEWKWVRPGAKIELQAGYRLTSEDAPVEFMVYEYMGFSDDGESVYRFYHPLELETVISPNAPAMDPVSFRQ